MAARKILAVVFPGFQVLDATGPLEVFSAASRLLAPAERIQRGAGDDRTRASTAAAPGTLRRATDAYRAELVSAHGGLVRSSSGLALDTRSMHDVRGPIDTLIVVGGAGVRDALGDGTLVQWTARAAGRSRRVASVCTGAFLLAETGLLDDLRVTTHWASCRSLARRYPGLTVDPDPIFIRHGKLATSAGVTSGMDLALALVEEDHGRDLALEVARWLVLFLKRPGGQSQFSGQLRQQSAARPPLADLQAWMADHLAGDLSVGALAGRVGMSTRTFSRVFRHDLGTTPAAYVERLRVEGARRDLEDTTRSMRDVARRNGFGTAETMYRAFQRALRVTPGEYRRRFARPAASA